TGFDRPVDVSGFESVDRRADDLAVGEQDPSGFRRTVDVHRAGRSRTRHKTKDVAEGEEFEVAAEHGDTLPGSSAREPAHERATSPGDVGTKQALLEEDGRLRTPPTAWRRSGRPRRSRPRTTGRPGRRASPVP